MVDWVIISFYLMVMLGVSIYYGCYTKTMSDYSVANKGYSTPILVASIVGIIMGAYSMLRAVGQVMTLGLSGLILYFARIFELLLTAQFIAPGLAKFKDAISPGDVMAHF